MEARKENIIIDKTFKFSLDIISLYQKLQVEKEFVLSKQLLRSATSIGANVEEASAAQSKKDFINKMSIASKEARETKYWLKLLDKSNLTQLNISPFLEEIEHIINILTKIIITAQTNLNNNNI
jgi:four helix bundle protein